MSKQPTTEEIQFLLDHNIIKEGVSNLSFSNLPSYKSFKVVTINNNNGSISFIVKDMETERNYKTLAKCLISIDDMPIDRIMQAYSAEDEMNKIEVIKKTDVRNKLFGKKSAKLNGIQLQDGMKVVLYNDADKTLNNKMLTVKGVGEKIVLTAPRGRPKKEKPENA